MADLYEENGRLYHLQKRGSYWLPHDDTECMRLDVLHNLFYDKNHLDLPLHTCPLQPRAGELLHILDLGCGTGFWVIDMADKYVNQAEVIGVDLVNIQPREIPANSIFLPNRDFNDSAWPFPPDRFDLIHLSMITACAVSWPCLYATAFRHLRPSTGFIEHLELDLAPHVRASTLPAENIISQFWTHLSSAAAVAQRDVIYDPRTTHDALLAAGFVDIEHSTVAIPWQYRPDREANYRLGAAFDVAFLNRDGLGAYAMAPFARVYGWPRRTTEEYVDAVCREVKKGEVEIDSFLHIWRARKP